MSLPKLARSTWGWLRVLVVLVVVTPQVVFGDTITVFAASSLRDAVSDIATEFEAATGSETVLVFAASSSIARQVARGAPADVVLLADQEWADWLVAQQAVETISPFAGNRLVLIGGGENTLTDAGEIRAFLGDGRLAMAQVDAVPAGRYGKAALMSLGLWGDLEPHVVQAANVRAALRFVERTEAPLGVGYGSDLVALPDLFEIYAFAPDTHPIILYSGAQVTPQGAEFMTFIQSIAAQETLARWGFLPLDAQ